MHEHYYSVIMAGGVGKRFWPRSRKNRPKQLLDIVGNNSMVNLTIERLQALSPVERILIITNYQQAQLILNQNDALTWDNFIIEPRGKNTAPAIGLAALELYHRDPKAIIGIFPADHRINDTDCFVRTVHQAIDYSQHNAALLTFGIVPTRPATGYGYIQIDKLNPLEDSAIGRVKTFAEKPNIATARRFIKSGEFFWNSGMFIWKAEDILNAISEYMPELSEALEQIKLYMGKDNFEEKLDYIWQGIQPISIDYGVLEQAQNVYVVKADFDWNDVGSWDAVYDLEPKDKNGNVFRADGAMFRSSQNYVFSQSVKVFLRNIHNLILIEDDGVLLVTPRGESEEVKEIVDTLTVIDKEELL
ncbi:MAG TPA: mannose-1-phosphate guanylyltransferase [Candidatus Marinimicrobia bacterium]|nr:mannose-1-phosphate guanylyltransferase [Candidatus Neomarinimicrobiota bacterium]